MLTGGWKNLIARIYGAPKGGPPKGTTSNSGRRPGSRLSIDRLEDRRVLDGIPAGFTGAITVTEGQVLMTAGPADGIADSYEVSVQHGEAGDTIEIRTGGETVFQAGVADFQSLAFQGSADVESLTVKLESGATLSGSIQFHGGTSSGDFVILMGGSAAGGLEQSPQRAGGAGIESALTVNATGSGSRVQIQDWQQGQPTGLQVTASRIDVTGFVDLGTAGATLAGDQISVSGVVKSDGGTISLQGTETSTVTIAGRIESTTTAPSARGGEINVFGHVVQLANSSGLDVSGAGGGGTIRIGGDFHGAAGDFTVAARTGIAPGAQLIADSLAEGNGGRIVIWSTEITGYYGAASARSTAGSGGFLEVSSTGTLLFRGDVDLYGSTGVGTLLLDPRTVTIESATFSPDDPALDSGVITFSEGGTAEYTISERKVESMTVNMLIQATDWIAIDIIDGEVLLQPNVSLTLQTENANAGNASGGIFCLDEHTILAARGSGSITLQAGVTANDQGEITGRNGAARIVTGQILTQSGHIVLEATGLVQIQNQLTTTGGSISIDGDAADNGTGQIEFGGPISTSGGLVSLVAGSFAGAPQINAGSGEISISSSGGKTLGLGSAVGDLIVTQATLTSWTGSELTVGGMRNGSVTVADLDLTTYAGGVTLLALKPGAQIAFTGSGSTFTSLSATAAAGIDVQCPLTTTAGTLFLDGGSELNLAANLTLTSSAADLALKADTGTITTQGPLTLSARAGVSLLSSMTMLGPLDANADSDGDGTGVFAVGSGAVVSGDGQHVTITAGDIELAGQVSLPGGTALLLATDSHSIALGTATGDWVLTGAELQGITAGVLTIGDSTNRVTVQEVSELQSQGISLLVLHGLDVTFAATGGASVFQALAADVASGEILRVDSNLSTLAGSLQLTGGGSDGTAGLVLGSGSTLTAATSLSLVTTAGTMLAEGPVTLRAGAGISILSSLDLQGTLLADADNDAVGGGTFTLASGTTLTGNTHLITITSADIDLAGLLANAGGTVTLLATSGRSVGVGTATGDWTLDGTELSHITAATLNLGDGTNPITVSGVTEEQSANIALASLSGLDVTFDGDPAGNVFQSLAATAAHDHLLTVETNLTTVAGDLVLIGGGSAGIAGLTIADGVTLNAAGLLQLQTQAGFIETQGAANLLANSGVTLLSDLTLSGPLVANADQDGVGAGTFTLGSGTTLTGNTHLITITSADIDLAGLLANAGGTVTLLATSGRSVGVGTATGDWTLNGTELSHITAATLNLGDGTNPITVSGVTAEQSANIALASLSGLNVTFDGDPAGNVFQTLTATAALDHLLTVETNLTTVVGDLQLMGGGAPGVAGLTIADGVTLNAAGLLRLQTQAGFIETQGAANLLANSGLNLLSDLTLSGPLVANADQDGVGAGTFTLSSGTTLTGNTHLITITSADIDLAGLLANAGGTVTLLATSGRSVGVGTATGDWTLNGTELSHITAATLKLGDGTNSIRVSEVEGSQSAGIALVAITGLDTTFAGAGTSSTFQSLKSSSAPGSTLRVDSDLTTLVGDLSLIGGGSTGSPGLVFGNSAILTSADLLQIQSLAGGIQSEGELELRASAGIEVLSDLSLLGPLSANADVDGNGTGLFTQAVGTLLTGNGQIIVISAADLDLLGSLTDAGGTVFLNASHGLTMGVGTATGDWTLDGTELSRIAAGTLSIGNGLNAVAVSEVTEQQSSAIYLVEVHGLDVTFAGLGFASVFQGLSAVAEPGHLLKIESNLTTVTSSLLLTGGGSAGTPGLTIAANVTLTSAQSLQLRSASGGMHAFGPLTLTASSGISILSSLQLDGELLANADSDATGAGSFLLSAGSKLSASALPITIASADINLAGTISDPGGTVTLVATGGQTMGVGAATGDWTLDSGEITRLVAAQLILGGETNGTVTVNALDSLLTAGFEQVEILALASGSGIVFTGGESSFRQLTASAAEDIVIETTVSSTFGPMSLQADANLDGAGAVQGATGLVQADQLFVDAGSGINLNTTISELNLANRAIGTVTIHESDSLVLRQVEQLGTGPVLVTAVGEISVQRTFATGLVTLDAGTAITNGPDPAVLPRLEAVTVALIARTGIGSGDPLVTSVSRLGAINTQAGQIEIQNVGQRPVTLGSAGSLAGLENQVAQVRIHTAGQMIVERIASPELISLTSLGGIEGTGGLGIDATAPQLALRTTGGTGEQTALETQISTLAATNLVSGGLRLVNVGGPLEIALADGLTGIENSGSGDIDIVNSTRLDVNAIITSTAGGSVILTALGDGSPGSDLTVNQPIRALGGYGDVILKAGTDLILVHSGGANDPDIQTTGLDDTHQGKILGNAENIVQYGQGVLLKSGTGQVSVLTPLLIDVDAPVIQQSISVLTGTFGNSAEFNYTITVNWSDGYVTSAYVPGPGSYYYEFPGPATTTVTISATAAGPGAFEFRHFYLGNPNVNDPSVPIPITVTVEDDVSIDLNGRAQLPVTTQINATDTLTTQNDQATVRTVAEVAGTGFQGLVFYTRLELPPITLVPQSVGVSVLEAVVVPAVEVQQAQKINTVQRESLVTARQVYLEVVAEGEEQAASDPVSDKETSTGDEATGLLPRPENLVELSEDVLNDLPALFQRLPDGHYRIYLQEVGETRLRLLLDVELRGGRPSDGADLNLDKPPAESLPGDSADESAGGVPTVPTRERGALPLQSRQAEVAPVVPPPNSDRELAGSRHRSELMAAGALLTAATAPSRVGWEAQVQEMLATTKPGDVRPGARLARRLKRRFE